MAVVTRLLMIYIGPSHFMGLGKVFPWMEILSANLVLFVSMHRLSRGLADEEVLCGYSLPVEATVVYPLGV